MVFVGYYCCHSLRGLCGLKSAEELCGRDQQWSQPARAVWIEIPLIPGGQDIMYLSQPARAVWIEIVFQHVTADRKIVTACEGCVD